LYPLLAFPAPLNHRINLALAFLFNCPPPFLSARLALFSLLSLFGPLPG
jgi:hypothetical protein